MIYIELDQPHYFLLPAIAVSLGPEFWIGVGWLNFEIGYRSGDDGGDGKQNHQEDPCTT